jgi:hypothetical protein
MARRYSAPFSFGADNTATNVADMTPQLVSMFNFDHARHVTAEELKSTPQHLGLFSFEAFAFEAGQKAPLGNKQPKRFNNHLNVPISSNDGKAHGQKEGKIDWSKVTFKDPSSVSELVPAPGCPTSLKARRIQPSAKRDPMFKAPVPKVPKIKVTPPEGSIKAPGPGLFRSLSAKVKGAKRHAVEGLKEIGARSSAELRRRRVERVFDGVSVYTGC